jgi:hypothetical protein
MNLLQELVWQLRAQHLGVFKKVNLIKDLRFSLKIKTYCRCAQRQAQYLN